MNKMRNWMVGLTIVALLAVGVVALAGNGYGSNTADRSPRQATSAACGLCERDADGDGIPNSEDADWVRPLDGSGYGQGRGYRQHLSADRPLDGTGQSAGPGGNRGQRGFGGVCDGSCL